MNDIKSINNERAKFAYDKLLNIPDNTKTKFRSLARNFPTMVQVNGLTAAVAFLYSKKENENEHKLMYDIISEQFKEKKELMCYITDIGSNELQLATVKVMALLVWVKRFAEGMFDANEGKKIRNFDISI